MEYKGKKICSIDVLDGDRVIANICDNKIETTNGYTIRVNPYVDEVKTDEK